MATVLSGLQLQCKATVTNRRIIFFPKALIIKPSLRCLLLQTYNPPKATAASVSNEDLTDTKHTTLLVESYHEHRRLKSLLERLKKKTSSPLQLLRDDGDWTRDQFWVVIKFLIHDSRPSQILQVFNGWKNMEASRINEFNYEKMIALLCEEDMMEEAVSAIDDMKSFGLRPSVDIFDSVIHCHARNGKFDDALFFLNEMKEMNLTPGVDTYHGLIQAYGKYKMYDEIGSCVKTMIMDGCIPDSDTNNLLIQEFSRAGLLGRMEKTFNIMRRKRMILHSSTWVAMLEAYANYGILEKIEDIYGNVARTKVVLKDDLVRKLAGVYIQNNMFSRLYDLGLDLSARTGRTDLVWCLRLLSHACLLSRKGMDFVMQEMDQARVSWTITIPNTILLAYLKMKDFNRMRLLLSQLPAHLLKPDMVTFGILFDAIRIGFNGCATLDAWRRAGLLYRSAEMNTDPLVLTAFGKGHFLKECEEKYSSLEPEIREKKRWTYHNLINLVKEHDG